MHLLICVKIIKINNYIIKDLFIINYLNLCLLLIIFNIFFIKKFLKYIFIKKFNLKNTPIYHIMKNTLI
jgi:hypothetical protein